MSSNNNKGLFFLLPCADSFRSVDLRTFSYNILPQQILTRDSVTVVVDVVIYARIFDATMSIINVENAHQSTKLLAATTLRNILGNKLLAELLTDRESISHRMQVTAAEGEMKASRALKEAADVISESPSALQLRYLQTLNSVAAEKNSTIIFPIPIDMISAMAKK